MDSFTEALLGWFDHHGRKDLPWQHNPTPYRVWVSEIMLQQTQVATVIDYYTRFMRRFTELAVLAEAPIDDVLHLWSGLGYYARARNLHRTARIVCAEHGGEFPGDIDRLTALPGIGRSTAGAVLALSRGQRQPILDGNVKRVLSRFHGVEGWAGHSAVAKQLWSIAEEHTPSERVQDYTQAIMDFGATVCTRTHPACGRCPLCAGCEALKCGEPTRYPSAKPRIEKPTRQTCFMIVSNEDNHVLLQKRAPTGIWGGLWSFPECDSIDDACIQAETLCGQRVREIQELPTLRHSFTHFNLHIDPIILRVGQTGVATSVADAAAQWVDPKTPPQIGLAAPVTQLLAALASRSDTMPTP